MNMKKKKVLTSLINLSHAYTAVPVTLNIKAHLFHALLVSHNLILAFVCTILHYAGVPHSFGLWTGTARLAFWLLLLSRGCGLLAGSVFRHDGGQVNYGGVKNLQESHTNILSFASSNTQ